MRVVIPTVPERRGYLHALLDAVRDEMPGATTVVVERAPHEEPGDRVARVFSERTPFLLLEDDVVLAPGFGDTVASIAIERAHSWVSLYSGAREWEPGYRPARRPFYGLCGLLVMRSAYGLVRYYRDWRDRHPEHRSAVDLAVGDYCHEHAIPLWVRFPSIVQHRVGPSAIGRRSSNRQSPSYRETFGDA